MLVSNCQTITYDQIREPDEKDWHPAVDLIEVDGEVGVGQDSETDGLDEEGKVTARQVDVVLEGLHAVHLADVDVEDVDHQGALDDVDGGEEDGGDGDVEVERVPLAVRDGGGVEPLVPGQRQHVLHHEVEGRHHLYRSLNAPGDAVRNPSEHLQSGKLHVVAIAGGGHVHEPEVDQVAQGGHEGVEEQAEKDHLDELLPPELEWFVSSSVRNKSSILITFVISLLTLFPNPKNWCLKLYVKR